MKTRSISLAVATAATLAVMASSAGAQQPAPQPPPAGPALPGVCILSIEGLYGTSAVGKSMSTRLEQLSSQANAELGSERAGIEADGKALDAQSSTLSPEQLQQKRGALGQRIQLWQRKYQIRNREMEVTQQKQQARVLQQAEPIVRQVFIQRGCSALLNGDSALIYPAPAMDVTGDVVRALDSKVQALTFDRERLEDSTAGQPAN